MKKLKFTALLGLGLIMVFSTISAQSVKKNEAKEVADSYKNISQYGLKQFVNMDLGIISYFPTKKDWRKISKQIELVPVDSLRYIDSLDVSRTSDTISVKIYSQNYAYYSQNSYKIARNTDHSTDTLMIFHMNVDFKIKRDVEDARTFRTGNYTIDYGTKQHIDNVDQRIILTKNFR